MSPDPSVHPHNSGWHLQEPLDTGKSLTLVVLPGDDFVDIVESSLRPDCPVHKLQKDKNMAVKGIMVTGYSIRSQKAVVVASLR